MAFRDVSPGAQAMFQMAQAPVNAFMDGQQNASRNALIGTQTRRMNMEMDEDEQVAQLLKTGKIDEAMVIDPDTTRMFLQAQQMQGQMRSQQAMSGLEDIPITRKPIDEQAVFNRGMKEREFAADEQHRRRQYSLDVAAESRMRQQPSGSPDSAKPPAGYRWKPDGSLEVIPGGPASVKTTPETTAQAADAKRVKSSQDVLAIIAEAEPLIAQATGSYGGYATDQVARVFGASTEGARATARLKALQAALMLKMPRMEGPQSNLDVQLYREAAGQIGDPTVPAETKMAALDSVRKLNEKYAGVAPSQSAPKSYKTKGGATVEILE